MVRKERRLKVFETRVPQEYVDVWKFVIGGWTQLHNEKLHNLYQVCF
jgi:hypothetical protein